jgi:hypothetical protein
MDYLSVSQFATQRGVSPSRVIYWLKRNRLAGARKVGSVWIVPSDADPAVKPVGRPRKERSFREQEEAMLELCASGPDLNAWRRAGPPDLMAGLAVMLASMTGFDRARYLQLAEGLDPDATTVDAFARWLGATPYKPSRFLPQLEKRLKGRAASSPGAGHVQP